MNTNNQPSVSIIIPCRNESRFIKECVDSVLAQDYPVELREILVVDGMSEDGTREILRGISAREPSVRMLDNPPKITPCALNTGIKNAKGAVIVRLDAHAKYEGDYISKCVRHLLESGADNVGGNMITLPPDDKIYSKAVVKVLSSRFGVGNSAFRTGLAKPGFVDTVFGGCYKKEVFEKIGLFNEKLARGQDMEFNLRLKKAGMKTLLVPEIVSYYYPKTGFADFLKHNFMNGMWAIIPFKYSTITPVSPRSLVPFVFVAAAAISAMVGIVLKSFVAPAIVSAPYAAVNLLFSSVIAAQSKDVRLLPAAAAAFASIHFAYGFGSAAGLFVTVFSKKIKPPSKE